MTAAWALVLASTLVGLGNEPGALELRDLADYRAALEGKPDELASAVTFRQLWDHPEAYERRRIRAEGRLTRRFRQEPVGTFPALVESWIVSPAGDPFCFVSADAAPAIDLGAVVVFEGTFLRKVAYRGGDVARLAPLVVGQHPPKVVEPAPKDEIPAATPDQERAERIWWACALAAAAVVGIGLARRHLTAPFHPPRRRDRDDGPPPDFVDNE